MILAIVLLVGTLVGCVAALETGQGINLTEIRRVEVISGSIGLATDQHYYRIYLRGDVAQPIKIEQLD